MLEIHPFGSFVPRKSKYLLLGSFATKPMKNYEWFYDNGRNQFWPIMTEVYSRDLTTKESKKKLFIDLEMALADIIYSCERLKNSNLDINLKNITYNTDGVTLIITQNRIEKIFFSSRFVENTFRKIFKNLFINYKHIELVTLPSPSPRYATLTKQEKIKKYKTLLPKMLK